MNGKPTPLLARARIRRRSRWSSRARRTDLEPPRAERRPEALDALAARLCRLARQPHRPRLDARPRQHLRQSGFPRTRALDGKRGADPRRQLRHRRARNDGASPNPDITGTLAFPSLDLTPYFAGLSTALRTGRDWREVDVDTDWLHDLTADIRLSAEAVQVGGLGFEQCRGERFAAERAAGDRSRPGRLQRRQPRRATSPSPIGRTAMERRLRCADARDQLRPRQGCPASRPAAGRVRARPPSCRPTTPAAAGGSARSSAGSPAPARSSRERRRAALRDRRCRGEAGEPGNPLPAEGPLRWPS